MIRIERISTCHWCHVMERESFEDDEVADLLNEHFVSIKVDREERPDVDHLYMTVCQAMTGQGGWPLTIILTPEKKPFFAGTYFPKKRMYGRNGLMEILVQINDRWKNNSIQIVKTSDRILHEVEKRMLSNVKGEVSLETLDKAYAHYEQLFDSVYGGFGGVPKFPTSHNLSFLLRYYKRTGKDKALKMVEKTLDSMSRGGMYDHVGFGFSRYSVDQKWLVPHFEKMLYDNALLAWTYIEAYQVTNNIKFANVAEQIFTYVFRDMTAPDGGFYSAEDADSEGHEGKFYVWQRGEVLEILGPDDGELYCELYGITEDGNFEGHNIPNLIRLNMERYAELNHVPLGELQQRVEICRQKLFNYREKRVHPGKDDKILTAWNGLMIMALAIGFKTLGRNEYLEAACRAVNCITDKLIRADGRLLARYRDGEAAFPAYVDDYAFVVWGLVELYEASFDHQFLQLAIDLNNHMLDLFWDDRNGGLYFYGSDSEQLLTRNKEIYDGALPSGNSVAALNILRLAKLTDNARLSEIAERQIQAFSGAVDQYPVGHSMFMIALDYAYNPSSEIVIAGDPALTQTADMISVVRNRFRPNTLVVLVPPGEKGEQIRNIVPLVQDKQPIGGRTTAYVCENFSCQSPVTNVEALRDMLD